MEGDWPPLLKQNQKWMLRAVRAGLSACKGPGRVIQETATDDRYRGQEMYLTHSE